MDPVELSNAISWADFWERIENAAFLAVVVALAIEFAALKFGAPYKKTIDHDREVKIATANERAANAELALEQYKAPRTLSPKQQETLIEALKPFAGQHFAFAVFSDPEPIALAKLLDSLLRTAKWVRMPDQFQWRGGIKVDVAGASAASISDSGIILYLAQDDRESIPATQLLCSMLTDTSLPCKINLNPELPVGKLPRTVTISVGKKP